MTETKSETPTVAPAEDPSTERRSLGEAAGPPEGTFEATTSRSAIRVDLGSAFAAEVLAAYVADEATPDGVRLEGTTLVVRPSAAASIVESMTEYGQRMLAGDRSGNMYRHGRLNRARWAIGLAAGVTVPKRVAYGPAPSKQSAAERAAERVDRVNAELAAARARKAAATKAPASKRDVTPIPKTGARRSA